MDVRDNSKFNQLTNMSNENEYANENWVSCCINYPGLSTSYLEKFDSVECNSKFAQKKYAYQQLKRTWMQNLV